MKLRLDISPCPNDTFMFDALINRRIDTCGLEFEAGFHDIEQLNGSLLAGEPVDVGKMSYALVPGVLQRYRLSDSGSALGYGNGPVLVARDPFTGEGFAGMRVAIPGRHTTANRLLTLFYPEITDKPCCLFSDIAAAVQQRRADAGVLIHEGRFTYRDRGLHLLADLGECWARQTAMPLPLGAIVISRALPGDVQRTVEELVRRSVAYAFEHPGASAQFVRGHAREMDEQVIRRHIDMFVNDFSLSLGEEGRAAVARLLGMDQAALFE